MRMKFLTSTPFAAGRILALALVMLGAADWASAQPTDAQLAAIKANCRSDFMSNCWGVPRGGAEAFQCLKDHLASLSAPCQQAVKAVIATATPPAGSGTAATAAKPSTETKPAAAAAATSPSPVGTENAAKAASASAASSASVAPTQSGTANMATSAGQGAASSNAKAAQGSSTAAATSQGNVAKKKPSAASSQAAAQTSGAAVAGSTGAAAAGKSEAKQAATQATAPVAPADTSAAMPTLGFIPPRKKFMLARFCRDDFNAHCPGVDLGGGRAIQCLEDNIASLAPQCRDALVKLGR
jgi:hypothetical protein